MITADANHGGSTCTMTAAPAAAAAAAAAAAGGAATAAASPMPAHPATNKPAGEIRSVPLWNR
jgi:hypothetical protein